MSVSVLLEGLLKEGLVDEFTQICKGAFQVTRAYDGCQGINLTLNVENQNNYTLVIASLISTFHYLMAARTLRQDLEQNQG